MTDYAEGNFLKLLLIRALENFPHERDARLNQILKLYCAIIIIYVRVCLKKYWNQRETKVCEVVLTYS
jgi:hypothetical protein